MSILFLMIVCSVSLASIFLGLFIYSTHKGQFDEGESPAVRMLMDDELNKVENKQQI